MSEGTESLHYSRRRDDINMLKGLLHEGSLPWDEQSPNAIFIWSNGQGSPYFIGRENFLDAERMLGTAPLSAKQIIDKIDAEELRRGIRVKCERCGRLHLGTEEGRKSHALWCEPEHVEADV